MLRMQFSSAAEMGSLLFVYAITYLIYVVRRLSFQFRVVPSTSDAVFQRMKCQVEASSAAHVCVLFRFSFFGCCCLNNAIASNTF